MFCFYFKHKAAAVFVAAVTMIIGVIGAVLCTGRSQLFVQPEYEKDYLYFSIFHLIISAVLTSGIIWEKPTLILLYQALHLATLTAFITHTVLYIPIGRIFFAIIISCSFLVYCIYNVYCYQEELKLKNKFLVGRVYFYFRNNNIQ